MTELHRSRKKIIKAEPPLEIIQLNILPRFPYKSVFRFKCICKQWQSFLSTYEFAMLHRNHNTKFQTSHKLLIVDRPPWSAFSSFDDKARKNEGLATFRPFPLEARGGVSPLASLDGLVVVCVNMKDYHELVIWNPLTGDYKKLADSKYLGFYSYDYYAIGLYIDASFDYKLLHINFTGAYVYSLRTDSWRKIEALEDTHVMTLLRRSSWSTATFFDGSLYFTLKHKSSIFSFDVKLEKFEEIQYPSVRDGAKFCGNLVVVKGCLHLCVSYVVDEDFLAPLSEIDLWRMNGDGWIKVVSAFSGIQQMPLRWTPICVMSNGEWVVCWEHDNEDTKGFTREQLCLYSATSLLQGVVFNESLVSPNIS